MEEKKIDVSKEACDKRIRARMEKEKKLDKIISLICSCVVIAGLVGIFITLLLGYYEIVSYTVPFELLVVLVLFFLMAVIAHARAEKLNSMTADDFVSEKLAELSLENDDTVRCPRCGSEHLTYQKKGFSEVKALIGMTLIGVWGVMFGVPGKDKIKATCLKCGHSFMIKKI